AVVNASGAGVNSNSVLVALLDSHYTELAELVEKALLLQTLEDAVGRHNVTIFAPRNEALERDLDPEFKRFLLEPRNLKSLQTLLLFHVLPARHPAGSWPAASHPTLSGEDVELAAGANGSMRVAHAAVTRPDAVLRPDGVIHGIERLLVPRSVQEDFNRRRSLAAISAVLPTGAPEVDPRTHRLKKPAPPVLPGAPPVLPVWDAMAPGPSIAPAPAPGPGGRLRQVRAGRGLRLPLRPGHLHGRQDLGAGHRRCAAPGGRQEAGHAGVRPGQEGARRHRLQEEQAPARQVVGGNVQNCWRLWSAIAISELPVEGWRKDSEED
uniref:FAS1 domain-containing protein n=1 Tax=Aegilops tauschii subsp. strangulata TaxID=200361 RepID=A0A453M0C1_AEGTS